MDRLSKCALCRFIISLPNTVNFLIMLYVYPTTFLEDIFNQIVKEEEYCINKLLLWTHLVTVILLNISIEIKFYFTYNSIYYYCNAWFFSCNTEVIAVPQSQIYHFIRHVNHQNSSSRFYVYKLKTPGYT